MDHETQRDGRMMPFNAHDMTRRRRRQLVEERLFAWQRRDQEEMDRRFPHPTRCRYADPGHVSRSKSEASHNQISQLMKLFLDLADQERWEDLEGLQLYLSQRIAEIRTTLPAELAPRDGLRRLHQEMSEALGAMMDGAVDGMLEPHETERILRETNEVLQVYRPLQRTLRARADETVDLR